MKLIQTKFPLLLSFVLLLTSCTSVKLITHYDEVTDKTITELQQKVTTFFVKIKNEIKSEATTYENNKSFYREAEVDLTTLKIRANAVEKNKITQEMLIELQAMLRDTERLHKLGFTSPDQIVPLEQRFESAFTAIIRFQLGLKAAKKI